MKKKQKIKKWVLEHKKGLIVAGITVTGSICIIVGFKKRKELTKLYMELKSVFSGSGAKRNNITHEPVLEIMDSLDIVETPMPEVLTRVDNEVLAKLPHDVSAHLRLLPDGYHASAEKIATAAEYGFDLTDSRYTWVKDYCTGKVA